MRLTRLIGALTLSILVYGGSAADSPVGYYRQPALSGDTLLFVAEGDLWKVPVVGGVARRLTSHPADESQPSVSPDGRTIAFVARYEGPAEVYTMPLEGGLPTRRTHGTGAVSVSGWTRDGRILYSTPAYSTLPDWQLVRLSVDDEATVRDADRIPLAQAADGCYDEGGTLYFTRLRFQGSHTKRYKGGTAQKIWRFDDSDEEATPLTADYDGTSKRPMCWRGRIYFASDRDGTMNLWSMDPGGADLRQHTRHVGWDVASPYFDAGRIVYQLGADLRLYDVQADSDRSLPIALDTDLDQMREHWVSKPLDYLTSAHLSPEGDAVALTARGQVFVAPVRRGRFVEATRAPGVRYRDARFMPGGKNLLTLSDQSGEVELWHVPANGVGPAEQLTGNGEVLRWEALPSPDGKWIAHHDKNQRLHVYDVQAQVDRTIDRSAIDGFDDLAWSPDSRWLAYVSAAENLFARIKLYEVKSGDTIPLTSDRFDSYDPAWSPDGKWLYFMSDRNLVSVVRSPWGSYQPEPYLDKTTHIYQVALRKGLRSPFAAPDELYVEEAKDDDGDDGKKKKKGKDKNDDAQPEPVEVTIARDGIDRRLQKLPVPPGNYSSLAVTEDALFWLSRKTRADRDQKLEAIAISNKDSEVETVVDDVRSFELSVDRKKILVRKGEALHVLDAEADKAKLEKTAVDLSDWTLSVIPREEWRQMFVEAWRLERDYFYDRNMHGIDWPALLDKFLPLVDRVTTRGELSNLIAQMVSELSALHTFVYGGDRREGPDDVRMASLGALLSRDDPAGGYRVERIYRADPDEPGRRAPLARPGIDVAEGDLIEAINGTPTLSVPDIHLLLRHKAGKQVLLRVRPGDGGDPRDVIVEPISPSRATDLRYHEWEYTRRLETEERGGGRIGYVHLRAMGGGNYTEWAKGFFPVFNREGLIIDVRHNRGGNIDSWILSRLLRKVWFHWSQRVGKAPVWNMQYAFQGHVVVLCDERTASDGEAFAEGIQRLEIGEVIGTRTWGGEIWLSSNNFLVDRGIATAAEFGVFGPEGDWLIEGHGVDPDIVVDNLPHATFEGRDAQLETAIDVLMRKIEEEPVERWPVPTHPDLSFEY